MESFDKVNEQAGRILILASGPSAKGLRLDLVRQARARGVYVLGVNRTWDWCQELDGWFTLDPNRYLMKFLFKKATDVARYVAVPADYGRPDARVLYHRNIPLFDGVTYLRRVAGIGPMKSVTGLATDPSCIHTGNSAYGALGVALHMKPQRVGLVGVDANRSAGYAYISGRPLTRLNHLPYLFDTAVPQLEAAGIEVKNGSLRSKVQCFPRCNPDQLMKWLMENL